MMRAGTLALGGVVLILGTLWIRAGVAATPLYRYGFEWFLKLGPGETEFLGRYLLVSLLAGGLLAAGWPLRIPQGGLSGRGLVPLGVLLALAATLGIGFGLLGDGPVTDDENVYLFQAQLLARGHAAWPAPPSPEFLTNVFVVARDGRWFGQYPPGHPLALVPGVWIGLPRLVPVLLAGLNLALLAGILAAVFERRAAVGALLLLASPLFLLTGSTLLSHSTAATGLSLAVLGAIRGWDENRVRWGLVTGLGLGVVFLARPWTAATLGLWPVGLLVAAAVRGRTHRVWLPAFLVATLALAGFLLYNWRVSGHPTLTGYAAVRGTSEFGFGTIFPGVHDHTPLQGLKNAALLGVRLLFWGWGSPLLVLAGCFAFRGRRPRRERVAAVLALAMIAGGLLSYVPYWAIGVNDTGPVKTYELLIPLAVLTVAGLRAMPDRRVLSPSGLLGGSILVAGVIFWPVQISHLAELRSRIEAPFALVEAEVERPALVFVTNVQARNATSWVFGRPNPRPDLQDPILYVRDRGPENLRYRQLHPGRHAYRLVHDDAGFHLDPLDGTRRPR